MDLYKVELPGGRVLYMTEESRRNIAALVSHINANATLLDKEDKPPNGAECLICVPSGNIFAIVKKNLTETDALIRAYIENL